MKDLTRDLTSLSTAQIEQRLREPGLDAAERTTLTEELTARIAEELLTGRDAPSPRERSSETHSFVQERATVVPPQQPPTRMTPQFTPPGAAPTPPGPGPLPARHVSAHPTTPPRNGFGRSLAGLISLVVVGAVAWGVIQALGNSSTGDGGRAARPFVPSQSSASPDPEPSPSRPPGPVGDVTISWVLGGVSYVAELSTDGSGGTAVVTYEDPYTFVEMVVAEDLRFTKRQGNAWYVGSNPRDYITDEPLGDDLYVSDDFALERNSDGWYFTQACSNGVCAPTSQQ